MKPKKPLLRIVREGTIGSCPVCRSTEAKKYLTNTNFQFGKVIGCINKECDEYYLNISYQRNKKLKKIGI